MITNVRKPSDKDIMSRYAKVLEVSAADMLRNNDNVIVLDPRASKQLDPEELKSVEFVIIGGIMGSHPPRGRTFINLTAKLPRAKPRNIGPYQYTIAGTAYVLKNIENGKKVSDISSVFGLRISKKLPKGVELEIFLPYAFPVDHNRRVVLPEDYLEIIAEHIPVYEQRILKTSDESIC